MAHKNPITNDLEFYRKLPYAIVIRRDECGGEPCFLAVHPELDGCMAQGATPQEAVANLQTAREDYIKTLLDDNLPVPLPQYLPATSESEAPAITRWYRFNAVQSSVEADTPASTPPRSQRNVLQLSM